MEHLEDLSERLGKPIIIKGKNNMKYMIRPDPPAAKRRTSYRDHEDEEYYREQEDLPLRRYMEQEDFDLGRRRRPVEFGAFEEDYFSEKAIRPRRPAYEKSGELNGVLSSSVQRLVNMAIVLFPPMIFLKE